MYGYQRRKGKKRVKLRTGDEQIHTTRYKIDKQQGLLLIYWTEDYCLRTIVYPLSTGFSRQEYCSELPFPPPRDLPHPGIKPKSPALQVDSLPTETPGKPLHSTGNDSHYLIINNNKHTQKHL